jgi:hypothetical protein
MQSRVKELKAHAYWDMKGYQNYAQQEIISENENLIAEADSLYQRTWELYDWARREGKTRRPAHPWNTEPASQSEYARALDVKGGEPVSPMRGVMQLYKQLTDMFVGLMKL